MDVYLIKLGKNAPVVGMSLDQVAKKYPKLNYRAIAIKRQDTSIIPKGDDVFMENDLAYVITKPEGVNHLFKIGGKQKVEIKNAMISGGGRIGRKAARQMEKQVNLKLIDIDRERCHRLTDSIRNTLIINGDARDVELLEDEGIRSMDAFIAVTDNSETNIFTCLLAKKFGVPKVIPLVDNIEYIDIAQNIGIDTIINKKLITASYIVRFTMDAEVTSMKCLAGLDAEALEYVVQPGAAATKNPIRKLNIPKGAIIGGVVRGNESFIALGNFQIHDYDRVVVFALPTAVKRTGALFN